MSEEVLQQQGIPAVKAEANKETETQGQVEKAIEKAKPYESKSFAAIAKREREVLNMRQQAKLEREALDAQKKEYEDWKATKELAKKNPKAYLEKAGLTYEELTEFLLNDQKPTADSEVKSVREELEKFKQEQAERLKLQEENELKLQQQAVEKTIADFKATISEMVSKDQEKYELINIFEQQDMIYDTISEHYALEVKKQEEDPSYKPKMLSKEEAADMVEKYLEDEQIARSSKSKKLQAKLNFQEKKDEPKKDDYQGWSSKTINNEQAISSAPSMLTPKTENDRLKRALAALGV